MKHDAPTEGVIRQYLLGQLDSQDELEAYLSEQMFFDDELSERIDSIEDEIIEDYLDGNTSAAERRAIEEYFLRPPERRRKLQFARTLRDHFESTSQILSKKKIGLPGQPTISSGEPVPHGFVKHWHIHSRAYWEIAAAVLLIVSASFYIASVNHKLQSQLDAARKNQAQINDELDRERQHSAILAQRLQAIPPVILAFPQGRFRQAGIPVILVKPWTQRIKVELELPDTFSNEYDVRLETKARQIIWSQVKLLALSGELQFDVPANLLSAGDYCLVVSSQPEPYCFRVRVSEN